VPGIQRSPLIQVTIYSRPGCHLCEEMKTVVQHVARSTPLALSEVDISSDAELETQYGLEIPVLMIEGKKAAKYRVTEEELRRILAGRKRKAGTGEAGKPGG
jgi:glutaredoxin